MKTVDDVMKRASEDLRAQGARNLPDRAWVPPRSINRSGMAVALAAATVVLVLLGLPALFNDPSDLTELGDPSPEPDVVSTQVSSDVPDLGRFSLTVYGGTHPDLGEVGCFSIASPDIPGITSACLEESLEEMTEDLHIRAVEACNDASAAVTTPEVGVVVLLGLPLEGATIELAFDDGRVDAIEADSSAAIWAWDNGTVGLLDIAVSGFSADQVRAAIDLPIGPCE